HQHVERALACEPANSLAWAIRGLLHGYVDADFNAAEADFTEALTNNPNESLAWLYLATLHGWRGRRAQAVDAAERALRLSPLHPQQPGAPVDVPGARHGPGPVGRPGVGEADDQGLARERPAIHGVRVPKGVAVAPVPGSGAAVRSIARSGGARGLRHERTRI